MKSVGVLAVYKISMLT